MKSSNVSREIEEIARKLLGAMQPTFPDYHPPEGEFKTRTKESAALAFINTIWGTPASLTLYAGLMLGLSCPNVLYVYRKRGRGNIYRVRLEFYKDDLTITPYWDIEVVKKGRRKKRTYYCRLIDYGVVVSRLGAIKPILKL